MSLTRESFKAYFQIPYSFNLISYKVDKIYLDWWNNKIFPKLSKITIVELIQSENLNFDFGLVVKANKKQKGKAKITHKDLAS